MERKRKEMKKTLRKEENDFNFEYVVGVDEVGLGCIAGPILSVAICFKKDNLSYLREICLETKRTKYFITDSKQLPENVREYFYNKIITLYSSIGYGWVTTEEINEIKNIHLCGIISRSRAVNDLLRWSEVVPDVILVDGPKIFDKFNLKEKIKIETVVGGDAKYVSIAAASIIAKVTRDNFMKNLDNEFPQYDWKQNKGYRSPKHLNAIKKYGLSIHHRTYLINEKGGL